ncbi:MAG TPA: hypothetical protein VFC44_25235 [Candidatus Saccharimonadales bacterium]|nr:hypothetical protein [Candidatus Saccharimonadales bacterium]
MKSINGCFSYWRGNLSAAKERHKMTILVVFVLWQGLYFASNYWNIDFVRIAAHSRWFDAMEICSIIGFSIWGLFWLPYVRHEVQVDEIKKLNGQLAEKEKQKHVKDKLGELLARIESFILDLHLGLGEFTGAVSDKAYSDFGQFCNEVSVFMQAELDNATAQYFLSTVGMEWTTADEKFTDEWKKRQGLEDIMVHRAKRLQAIIEKVM